jgi:hypothetical protein
VAIEPNVTPPATQAARVSAIENEFPAYRAISPPAVLSLIAGVLAVLCFTHWFFLLFAVAAVVLGLYADRRIQRMPEVLTGRGLAQGGIALGLIFGISSVTTVTVQSVLRELEAKKFMSRYIASLKTGKVEEVMFYQIPPSAREGKTAAQAYEEMTAATPEPMMAEMKTRPVKSMLERLASGSGADVRLSKIEASGVDGMDLFAAVLLELTGPTSEKFPEPTQYALVLTKMRTDRTSSDWWVEEVRFPYKRNTYVPAPKAVDDGHGHGELHAN